MKIVRISAVWCMSCIVTHEEWLKVKENHKTIEFIELDYDIDDIEKYHVSDILPITIFYKDNEEVRRIEGEFKEKDIERVIADEKMDI